MKDLSSPFKKENGGIGLNPRLPVENSFLSVKL
jgi:hypothetical protein